jgi:hypothetical protein
MRAEMVPQISFESPQKLLDLKSKEIPISFGFEFICALLLAAPLLLFWGSCRVWRVREESSSFNEEFLGEIFHEVGEEIVKEQQLLLLSFFFHTQLSTNTQSIDQLDQI